jgi:hypothetical protein
MKIFKILFLVLLLPSCEILKKIQVKGEVNGVKTGSSKIIGGKHMITAIYPVSDRLRIKGKIAQPYIIEQTMDIGLPNYGETSLEILF